MSNTVLTPREVWVVWHEPIPKDEVTHQVEKGEPWPRRKRTGVIQQYIWTYEPFPSGKFDCKVQAVIYDPDVGQVVMKPFSEFNVLKPKPSMAEQIQDAVRQQATLEVAA